MNMKDEMLPEYDFSDGIRGKYAKRCAEGIKLPQRKSIRLPNYDYQQNSAYFVTICIQHKKCLLGEITQGEMLKNDVGLMIEKWWHELLNKYSVDLDEYVIMPNHFRSFIYC
jgi:hypothetical protein